MNKLYIKQCNCCNKRYFGWTQKDNVNTYYGSGKEWLAHVGRNLKNHKTILVHEYSSSEQCHRVAKRFSRFYKIALSAEWFNIVDEEGRNGASFPGESNPMFGSARHSDANPMFGKTHKQSTKDLISEKAKVHSKGERNGRYDPTVFTLKHRVTGEVITGTKLDLKNLYGIARSNFAKYLRGDLKHIHNYQLQETI